MKRAVSVDVEDRIVHLYSEESVQARPICVHKHLLCGTSSAFQRLVDRSEKRGDNTIAITTQLSHSACRTLARWIYGQPMWNIAEVDGSDDLKRLAEIYDFVYEDDEPYDKNCIEACVDSMKQVLVQNSRSLSNPLESLQLAIETDERETGPVRAMLIKQLVYDDCARSGLARLWLAQYREEETVTDFLEDLCVAFADKASKESAAQNGKQT